MYVCVHVYVSLSHIDIDITSRRKKGGKIKNKDNNIHSFIQHRRSQTSQSLVNITTLTPQSIELTKS